MKLRCTPNSIRLRVRKSDLELLQQDGVVLAPLHFAQGVQLTYALKIGEVPMPQATYTEHQISVTLPHPLAEQWINSERVSIEYQQPVGAGQTLHILIEKDFPCRHTEEKDLKDTFFELAPKEDKAC